MEVTGAFLFFLTILLIGIFPTPLLYILSDLLRLFVHRITGYRKDVVRRNISDSFPGITNEELKRLTRLFYKNLTDIILEGIWAFTISRKQVLNRFRIINPEVLGPFYNSGQSVIGVTGHYANWEWGSLSASLQTDHNIIAFYKPLTNRYIDKFLRWSRSRFGTTLASIDETSLTFVKCRHEASVFLMVSDQNVSGKYIDKAYWINFLNRDTAFLHGMEKHARLNNLPVLYIDIQRIRRGYYTCELSLLTAKPNELEEGVLTELYAKKLESVIVTKPEDWLWSHKRWKSTR